MPSAETSNKALSDTATQVIQILAGMVMLQDSNPQHLGLAVQVGEIMVGISVLAPGDILISSIPLPVFATHSISATVVPLVLLSAAMEMLEHLDNTQQWFVSVLVWENISSDDPQIQQHSLKDKACTILVSRLVPSISTTGVAKSMPGPGPSKPKPKPALKKKLVEGKVDKGKGRTLAIEKRRKDSGSSKPPAPPGDLQSSSGNSAPLLAIFSKKQKVAQDPVPPPADVPQEDITTDMDAPEVVPHCDQCIKLDMVPPGLHSKPVPGAQGESVVPSLQHSMEVDPEGDAIVNDLQAMTLEVKNDSAA
ncbi:hypothetical protein EDB19DRAFT_1914422 [Suillus lakei]|nr:hypothetical protein EDB19DRAFT_1914422 [Suillus lakei]